MIREYWTDGSTRSNGSADAVGAYGFIEVKDDEEILHRVEVERGTTNQRMELSAALLACETANALEGFDTINIYSDSAYLINCISQHWYKKWQINGWINSKKEPVANKDLWQKLIPYFECGNYTFSKVPGHQNNKFNNRIDALVQNASLRCKND